MKNMLIAVTASMFGWGVASLINKEVNKRMEEKKLAQIEPDPESKSENSELTEAAQQVIDAANNLIKFTAKQEEQAKAPQFTTVKN